ncbi:hypothetical protein NLM33_17480 [Bradyrhizobium sp. CCGUVB1N3]|uniref:hypothetical protein n=1 Tax=Bradyrhizobium sp. CCGUVB1N3 TaxID=2949629 RepID=UPI0020B20155|nr:hypothetical protein [Bradyrhizobium sp. CCGUVB1N3]MCP3472112.1 hypothetical protein [Bradyrhizobium sp. CCGUVB1N3]
MTIGMRCATRRAVLGVVGGALNGNLRGALADPNVHQLLSALDIGVVTDTRVEFSRIIKADYDRWGGVIRSSGFTLE